MTSENYHPDESSGLNVVLGANGAFGRAILNSLIEKNVAVRAMTRSERSIRMLPSDKVEVFVGDILKEEDARNALKGAAVVYFAINFPYSEWASSYPVAVRNTLKSLDPGIKPIFVFPGNVYGYGVFRSLPVKETHPLVAKSKKGMLRNSIEATLMYYHRKNRIRLLLPRFADFYGPNVTNALYGAMFSRPLEGRSPIWPINADVLHNFTFINDAARATLALMEDSTSCGEAYHIAGEAITAREFIMIILRELNSNLKLKVLSGKFLKLASLLNPNIRELTELLYEYQNPYILDCSKFNEKHPEFLYTTYRNGIKITLDWFRNHVQT